MELNAVFWEKGKNKSEFSLLLRLISSVQLCPCATTDWGSGRVGGARGAQGLRTHPHPHPHTQTRAHTCRRQQNPTNICHIKERLCFHAFLCKHTEKPQKHDYKKTHEHSDTTFVIDSTGTLETSLFVLFIYITTI